MSKGEMLERMMAALPHTEYTYDIDAEKGVAYVTGRMEEFVVTVKQVE